MKRRYFSIPLCLILVTIITSFLGQKSEIQQPSRSIASVENYHDTTEAISSKVSELTMACDEIECPEYIAHIRINEKRVCTGFLIGKNKVMTNHHCIFDSVDNCEGVKVYINNPYNVETLEYSCRKILHTGSDKLDLNDKDYAILQLSEEVVNEPVDYTGDDLNANDSFEVFVTDWNKSNDSLMIKKYDCEAVIDHHIYKFAKYKTHSILAFKNCPIVEGNSGAPIINKRTKKLVGILARNYTIDRSKLRSAYSEVNFDLVENLGIGINATCFDFRSSPIFSNNKLRKCAELDLSENNKNKILHGLSMKAIHQVNDYIDDTHITWLKTRSHGVFPYCLKNIDQSIKSLQGKSKLDYQLSVPRFKTVMTISPFFIQNIQAIPIRENNTYEVELKLVDKGVDSLILSIKNLNNSRVGDSWILKDCGSDLDEFLVSSEL